MNRRFGCLLMAALVWLVACAPMRSSDTTPAWSHYTAYRTALEQSEDEPRYRDHLTESMLTPLERASDTRERDEIRGLLAFPLWLTSTAGHFEKKVPGGRCLTVNGHNQRGEPMAIAVRIKQGADGLRIHEIHAAYVPDAGAWPERAHCPEEPILQP